MKLEGMRVLVVGTGISGVAAVKLLAFYHADIVLLEGNDRIAKTEVLKRLPKEIEVELIMGELEEEVMDTIELAVLSPGVPTDLLFVNRMREKQIPIWGEIELAYQCAKGRLAAITGTNGKTTTTALTGEIFKSYYDSVFVVGNIGMPYTEYAAQMTEDSVTVAEVSSFQLETTEEFCPQVSAILNITEDHLNRHYTMENYANVKKRIAAKQTKDEICVLNYEDEWLQKAAKDIPAKVFFFSSVRKLEEGIYMDEEQNFVLRAGGEEIVVCNVSDLQLLGTHSYENVMAAIAITYFMGVPVSYIKKAVSEFQAVEHRIEYVTEKKGVKYYNDSKGTNPDAAIKAIQAMVRPTVLIGGGYDKQSTYEEWMDECKDKITYLVLLGATKEKIAEAARKKGIKNIIMADSLKEAVTVSAAHANPGEAVLLSPACASWDMFTSYEERGRMFKEYVMALED